MRSLLFAKRDDLRAGCAKASTVGVDQLAAGVPGALKRFACCSLSGYGQTEISMGGTAVQAAPTLQY